MKRLIAIIACAAVLVLVVSAFLSEYRFGHGYLQAFADEYTSSYATQDDSDWEETVGDTLTLRNGDMQLTMDTATTHFTVVDMVSGQQYSSYPEGELTPVTTEDGIRLQSNVALLYRTENNDAQYMSAYDDSVANENFRILHKGNAVRIYYTMGFDADSIFLPLVFTQEVFETRVRANLSNAQNRQLDRRYKLYTPENPTEEYKDMLADYPDLASQALYIYTSSYDMVTVRGVASLMEQAGYTQGDYANDTASLTVQESGLMPSGFVVPLEIELTETGIKARILMDRVTSSNESDELVKIYLLEFFGAAEQQDGYFIVPDGSGAEIDLSIPSTSDYIQSLYADNPSISKERQAQLTQLAHLPVFGYANGTAGYAAVVRGAKASCVKNNVNVVNNVYANFTVTDNEESTIGADRGLPVDYMYADQMLVENPEVEYIFLEDTYDTEEIASVYHSQAGLGELEEGDAPVYLDFLCSVNVEKNFLGITYNSLETLSNLSDICDVVERLQARGITNLRVRLSGLLADGVYNKAVTSLKWNGKIGSREDFQRLKEMILSAGGRLYIDLPISLVYREAVFDAYPVNTFTARRLNDTQVMTSSYDLISLRYLEDGDAYVVSPGTYQEVAQRIIQSYQADDLFSGIGFSWSDIGSILPADYSRKTFYDRNMTARLVADTMSTLKETSGLLMTDRASDYMLGSADDVVNVPLYSSGYLSETADVPLYAMLLKGQRSFAGSALNLSSRFERDLAMSAAVGAGQYYLFITKDDSLLQKSGLSEMYYSLQVEHSIGRLEENYAAYNEVFRATAGCTIRTAEYLAQDVLQVTYDNGARVIANLSAQDYRQDGLTLESGAYQLMK